MKVLILIAHANDNGLSSSHRLAEYAKEALVEDGHEVRVVDLVKSGFDKCGTSSDFTSIPLEKFDYENCHTPSNDNLIEIVVEHQKNVTWCSHIIVIGPMWFYRYPACFYAYTERVFCNFFGYTSTKFGDSGPLKGKKVMCVMTLGGFEATYVPSGPLTTVENILYHVTRGHFSYCGLTCLRSQAFYGCGQFKSMFDEKPEIIEKWKKAVKNLDKRPLIPLLDGVTPVGEGNKNEGHILSSLPDLTLDEAIEAK